MIKKLRWMVAILYIVGTQAYASSTSEQIQALLKSENKLTFEGQTLNKKALTELYEANQFKPIWQQNVDAWLRKKALLHPLKNVESHGLRSKDYPVDKLDKLLAQKDTQDLAYADLFASHLVLRYIDEIKFGRYVPVELAPVTRLKKKNIQSPSSASILFDALTSVVGIETFLTRLAPQHKEYIRLKSALEHLRALENKRGFTKVKQGSVVKLGDKDWRVPSLRKRLWQQGILSTLFYTKNRLFNVHVAKALKEFQRRHGLPETGELDNETVEELNVPISSRINQIIINMERWRWLPEALASRHIRINIADQYLNAVQGKRTELLTKVTLEKSLENLPLTSTFIGSAQQTPELQFNINNKEPLFLSAQGTSSLPKGCICITDITPLANWILKKEGWSNKSKQKSSLTLQQDLPVYIVYWTAWVDNKGAIHFRKDRLGRDQQMTQALL